MHRNRGTQSPRPFKEDGERLRRARERMDLSAYTVARGAGYGADMVWAVERGERKASDEHVLFLVAVSRRRGNTYPALGQELLDARHAACKVCTFDVVYGAVPEFTRPSAA